MTREVIKDTGLAIKYGLKLELVFHTSYSCSFLVFVKILKLL